MTTTTTTTTMTDASLAFGVWEQKIKKKFGRLREKKRHKIVKILRAYTSHLTFVFAARRASTSYATTSTSTSSSTSPGVASRGRSKTSVRTYAFTPSSSASATSATSTYSSSSSSSPVKKTIIITATIRNHQKLSPTLEKACSSTVRWMKFGETRNRRNR